VTYVIGFREFGVNSIVSDARISHDGFGTNTALKTGQLFPGCIFGRSGNEETGRQFILAARTYVQPSVDSCEDNSAEQYWTRFQEFVSFYDFPGGAESDTRGFKMLLSTRSSGNPELYLLDSSDRVLAPVSDRWISIGSGKALLDPLVEHDYLSRVEEIARYLEESGIPWSYPYFLCLWLSELTLSAEQSRLESVGVGGVFHFIYQTATCESPQEPALYVLSMADCDTRTIYLWLYRICYTRGCVAVEEVIPPGQLLHAPNGEHKCTILCNEASRPDIKNALETGGLEECIKEDLNRLPFYFFCGFGVANPSDRKGWGYHITNEGKYVVTKDGVIAPFYQELIASQFEPDHRFAFFSAAVQGFTRIIEAEPDNVAAYYNRGTAYAFVGLLREAIVDFDKAIELGSNHPRLSDVYHNRARTFYKLAILDYGQFLGLEPDAPEREALLQLIEQVKRTP
jgi:tetratricopeptide (TPR) repeat protein